MFSEISFPIRGFKTFTYSIPQKLLNKVQVGSRVNVNFGYRRAQGIVVALIEKPTFKGQIKEIDSLVDDVSIITPELWKLILWISNYYMTPYGQVAKTLFPKNLSTRYVPRKNWYVKYKSISNFDAVTLNKRAPKQHLLLNKITETGKATKVSLLKEYASDPLRICKVLHKKNFVELYEETSFPDVTGFSFKPVFKKISFNSEQKKVLCVITKSIKDKKYDPFLLHGVTGSGKTELYIEAVRHCLEQNRSAIILLPEISLTPQIAGRFRAVFGDTIALWHSKLTQQQRSWTWKQICIGEFKVVIGARSAVFSPLKNLGLIVIDEEQETSFQQDSSAPRYHARDVALMRGKIEKSVVIISSATPSLESYYNYLNHKIKYLRLKNRFGKAKEPEVHVVDMIKDKDDSGKKDLVISGLLQDKIEDRLLKKEQVILLQNRRGFSSSAQCNQCREIVMCSECHVSLTFHQYESILLCHYCGYHKNIGNCICRKCNGNELRFFGSGTQKVEIIIRETFPHAKIRRLDLDSSKGTEGTVAILESFNKGDIDILIGTQMIAKGLDFPNTTLVGIINADLGLFIPDFRAGEKTFQLIYQAAGRAGRSHKPGEVIIQSYSVDNPVIKYASSLNILEYYKIAMDERKELNYPPFSWIAKVEITGTDEKLTNNLSKKLCENLTGEYRGLEILGPAPCFLKKLRKNYRYQIVFKSNKKIDPSGKKLHSFVKLNFKNSHKLFQAIKNRVTIHFDPLSLI